ncbi:MAG: nucleotidyltransferase family protein [Brevundimonas sp.]
MTREELLTRLRELKPWLEEQGIVNLRLFGSYARDEAGPDSDVDLLVDLSRPL